MESEKVGKLLVKQLELLTSICENSESHTEVVFVLKNAHNDIKFMMCMHVELKLI